MIARLRRVVAREGLRGAAARAGELALARVVLHEQHVWYELDLVAARPRRPLAEGLELRRLPPGGDVSAYEAIQPLGAKGVAAYRACDGTAWVVTEDESPIFGCWTFPARAPVMAAPGGVLELPPATALLEDSVTTPAARGRGVAPATWTQVADTLRDEGATRMITKVEVENAPSRRAVEKAGFREVALMDFRRTGPRRQVRVSGAEDGLGPALAARLGGAAPRA